MVAYSNTFLPTILDVQTSARSITEFNPLTGQTQPPDATNSTLRGWTDVADPLPGKHVPLESYESELEREHALPTSVPNADILKTNSNPTYHKPSLKVLRIIVAGTHFVERHVSGYIEQCRATSDDIAATLLTVRQGTVSTLSPDVSGYTCRSTNCPSGHEALVFHYLYV
uniref:SFRICE_006516 n=1 Tax=Spodoptera frugiperda TaxID=7108 RepID=A0A2H1WP96_SPOFR